MKTTDKLIQKYINFGGTRTYLEFVQFHVEVAKEKQNHKAHSRDYVCLEYILRKLEKGIVYCSQHGDVIDEVIIEDTVKDIERGYDIQHDPVKKKKSKGKGLGKRPSKGLGKIVDDGRVPPEGNSDVYWRKKGIETVFLPNDARVRKGNKLDSSYKYSDMRFIENYYGLRAIEYGNWLSQQDRLNYLSGLGLALYDLHSLLGFTPKNIGLKGRLNVAFGARGRGKALAHFDSGSFTINLTRYSRPPQEQKRSENFKRVNLILKDGGVGAFAHEYGHALDYYGALYVEKGDNFSLSRDRSIDPKPKIELLKKNTLHGLMEKLLYKIIWDKEGKKFSVYYARLIKASKKKYYKQRNEIFARAFEVYVQYKLAKKKHKNIFLSRVKYNPKFYLTLLEMKKIEPEFDALIKALKKHL